MLVVFAAAVFATAATSPAQTTIPIARVQGSLLLDAAHPAALSRLVVRLDEVATSSSPQISVHLRIAGVRPAGGGAAITDSSAARFIVLSAAPGAVPSSLPSESLGGEPSLQAVPSAWQAEAQFGLGVDLPIQCGIGPCERAFWLIGQLVSADIGDITVDWQVDGYLGYPGNVYPSGAGATVAIDPPIQVAAPIPRLFVSTDVETLHLGPDNPVAARVVEVRLGAAAIPADASAVGALSVDVSSRTGGSGDRRPLVEVYPLGGDRTPLPNGVDPFAGCTPGEDCVRRFVVGIAWSGDQGDAEAIDWSLTVRRVDLVRAWSSPAELTASVTRRFDVDPSREPVVIHREGTATSVTGTTEAQVQLSLAASTIATEPLAELLPVPAVMTYRVHLLGIDPTATSDGGTFGTISGASGRVPGIQFPIGDGAQIVVTNPLVGCRIGERCPDLLIKTYRGTIDTVPRPPVRVQWTLDLRVYSFVDIPIRFALEDHSP